MCGGVVCGGSMSRVSHLVDQVPGRRAWSGEIEIALDAAPGDVPRVERVALQLACEWVTQSIVRWQVIFHEAVPGAVRATYSAVRVRRSRAHVDDLPRSQWFSIVVVKHSRTKAFAH